MHTVDWLPPEPLTIDQGLEYKRTFDHIEMCTPMLGVHPDPKDYVALLYVGIGDQTIYAVFDPGIPAWVAIEAGPDRTVIPQAERILTEAMDLLGSRYRNSTFALLERARLRR